MTLLRTAFRIAIVEALCPAAALVSAGPFPTLAGPRVFDSKFTPTDDLASGEQLPVVTVYTGLDDSDPSQPSSGGPPFLRHIHVEIEMAVVGLVQAPNDEDGNPQVGIEWPETDPELEAKLDVLEAQVRFCLLKGPTGLLYRRLGGMRVRDIQSDIDRTSEEKIRLAMRVLRIRLSVDDDCEHLLPVTALTGTARLPDRIKALYDALHETAYGRAVLALLAPAAPTGPVRNPLNTVSIGYDVADPESVVDGVVDISAPVSITQDPPP